MKIPGEAFTLDTSGSHAACRPGGGTRRSRRAYPRSQSAKNGRGMQPKGLPKRSAEMCAAINEKGLADAEANERITYR